MPVQMTRAEFQAQQVERMRLMTDKDLDCIKCPDCEGQWFEEVRCQRFKVDHHVILGQPIPAKEGSVPYIMLKCVHCGHMIAPKVLHSVRDTAGGDYDHFLDTVEGKMDKRAEEVKSEKI